MLQIFFLLYFFCLGRLWQKTFARLCGWERRGAPSFLLGVFAHVLLVGLLSSVFVVWYRLTPGSIACVFAIAAACAIAIFRYARRLKRPQTQEDMAKTDPPFLLPRSRIAVSLFLALAAGAGVLLVSSQADAPLFSPWQAISAWYVPIFFLSTAALGLLLFSQTPHRTLLALVIVHSLVAHLYLPASHALPWGGDVWRHIGVEQQLLDGKFYPPVLFGPEATYRALLIPNKYAYGHLWGTTVLLSRISGVDLRTINRWLGPILWGVMLPILLERLGRLLFRSRRWGLWLATFAALPFPLQSLGALTLPVSLGLLAFLFAVLVWFSLPQDRRIRRVFIAFSALFAFGYSLYAILLWFLIAASHLCKKPYRIVLIPAGLLFFPMVELLARTSRIPASWDAWQSLKQMVGQFSGWFFASLIRPHDIPSANIIFNHLPLQAFVPSPFLAWRWWMIPALCVLWGGAFFGAYRAWKENDWRWRTLAFLGSTALGGYLVGWYFLEGERLFVRRLDALLAVLLILFFLKGALHVSSVIYHLSKKYHLSSISYGVSMILVVFAFAWFTTATYVSGPDVRVVGRDEYRVAQVIWKAEKTRERHCVLADTWLLLALEGISSRGIVGGGFHIDANFGQPERVALFEELKERPQKDILADARMHTGASVCAIALPVGNEGDTRRKEIDAIVGHGAEDVGDIVVWMP